MVQEKERNYGRLKICQFHITHSLKLVMKGSIKTKHKINHKSPVEIKQKRNIETIQWKDFLKTQHKIWWEELRTNNLANQSLYLIKSGNKQSTSRNWRWLREYETCSGHDLNPPWLSTQQQQQQQKTIIVSKKSNG